MPDTGKWSSDQPGELVTMPTAGEVTEFIAAEHVENEAKVERLAKAIFGRYGDSGYSWGNLDDAWHGHWLKEAREILEEIE